MSLSSRARFWLDLAERAAKSAVQGFALYWTLFQGADADAVLTANNLKAALGAAFFSVMMSLGSSRIGNNDDASALPTAVDPATVNDPSNRAVAAAVGDPADDQRTEHEKLAALDVPPPPAELDGGTLKGFPSAKTSAKKVAATKR